MKTMHRYFVPILLLSISLPAFSADPHEIDRLQRQCENEKGSLLRDRRGTPSCDQLDRIFKRPMAFPRPKTPPPNLKKKRSNHSPNTAGTACIRKIAFMIKTATHPPAFNFPNGLAITIGLAVHFLTYNAFSDRHCQPGKCLSEIPFGFSPHPI